MNLKDKVMFIGIGCYGGKQVKEFVENYGYKGIAVNGSEQDLRALGGMNKYHLKILMGLAVTGREPWSVWNKIPIFGLHKQYRGRDYFPCIWRWWFYWFR